LLEHQGTFGRTCSSFVVALFIARSLIKAHNPSAFVSAPSNSLELNYGGIVASKYMFCLAAKLDSRSFYFAELCSSFVVASRPI
jgi:hypothetical protein